MYVVRNQRKVNHKRQNVSCENQDRRNTTGSIPVNKKIKVRKACPAISGRTNGLSFVHNWVGLMKSHSKSESEINCFHTNEQVKIEEQSYEVNYNNQENDAGHKGKNP